MCEICYKKSFKKSGIMMKLGIMQPYFFPYIGYWQLINAVDKYVIYDDVNYIKGGWINRNRVLINGEAKYLNLQLDQASPNKKINEINISTNEITRKKFMNTLQMSYSKAPYFDGCFTLVEKIMSHNSVNLAQFLDNSIRCVCDYLGMETDIILSSNLIKNNDLKGEDKVIEICKVLNADSYYNAVGGQELYSKDRFRANGIELCFLKTNNISYEQFKNEFVSNLSIIDVLMFNSKDEVKKMLEEYELV